MSAKTTPVGAAGTTLGFNLGGSSSFTTLGELMDDCGFAGFETGKIPLKILANVILTKTPGRIDNGSFDGSLYLVPGDTTVIQMQTLQANRTTCAWLLTMVDGSTPTTGTTYAFSGFVSHVAPSGFTGDDAPTLPFSIEISGAVICTVGS